MKKVAVLVVGFMGLLWACSDSGRIDTEYLGTWRLQTRKNLHTILSLRNNGSFEIDLRIEGQLTKIVEKRGKASGTWETNSAEGRFTLFVTQGDTTIGWPEGVRNYHIHQMNGDFLHLVSPDGKAYRWEKIRRQQGVNRSKADNEIITLAPLVVNLSPSDIKAHQRYKWLCVALDFVLRDEDEPLPIRPQWREKVIILLSSKVYSELNTQDKLLKVSEELKKLVNPYMGGRVEDVVFNKTVVTGNKEAVDAFNAEFGQGKK